MGIARLLAKGWVVFCLFAGGHALHLALMSGLPLASSVFAIGICAALFIAMGLLFAGGYGVSGGGASGVSGLGGGFGGGGAALFSRFDPSRLIPGFNETVFLLFVVISFVNQVFFASYNIAGGAAGALESAIYFAVPGQRALVDALSSCVLDGGRIFASSVSWLLAIIYLASTVSRLKLAASIIRLDRRPDALGPTVRAFLLGAGTVVGIQFLFVGSAYPWLACHAFDDITGALLIGLAPLMLAYLIVAALASLMASGGENK